MLEKEFQFFEDHKDQLIEKYNNRFIVIKDQKVIADFSSEIEAISETKKAHEMGTFLVQHATKKEAALVHKFHSRVYFDDEISPRL